MLLNAARSVAPPLDLNAIELELFPESRSPRTGRLDWESFATICERVASQIGDDEDVVAFAETLIPGGSMNILQRLGRSVLDPTDLYEIGARWLGPSVLPMIDGQMIRNADGSVVQRLTMVEGHRPSRAVFLLFVGFFQASPVAWGEPRANVEVRFLPNAAEYVIRTASRKPGLLSRLVRRARSRAAMESLLDELGGQRTDIFESYREVHAARDRIAEQADALSKVNAIGHELSRHIELDQVADVLMRTLVDDLGFAGAALTAARPTDAQDSADLYLSPRRQPAFQRESGRTEGEPTGVYALEGATGAIGTLAVWSTTTGAIPSASPNDGGISLLERLLPWISIAVSNARTYRELERHADDLQERVRERTARLLSVNHHLVREIEERKRATDALVESEAQLRASERLASVGTLAAGIAHEINNPVGSILAAAQFAQVVEQDSGERAQIGAALTDIVREAKRCGGIVRSVLQFARDERTDKWDCRLDEVLRRSIHLAEPFASERGAELHLSLPKDAVWVRVNPIQIEQAVMNLVRNAIEAGSGHVRLALDVLDDEQLALVQVDDDGPGIPAEDRVRIFEPFYTTRRGEGGTGLGLSVVHGIASEHLGQLKVEANERGGVAALLELPRVQPPAVAYEEKREDDPS